MAGGHTRTRPPRQRLRQHLGYPVTVSTAWARVYLGMHHTIDVALGAVMGIAALAITIRSLNMRLDGIDDPLNPDTP